MGVTCGGQYLKASLLSNSLLWRNRCSSYRHLWSIGTHTDIATDNEFCIKKIHQKWYLTNSCSTHTDKRCWCMQSAMMLATTTCVRFTTMYNRNDTPYSILYIPRKKNNSKVLGFPKSSWSPTLVTSDVHVLNHQPTQPPWPKLYTPLRHQSSLAFS